MHFKIHAFPPEEFPQGHLLSAGPFLELDEAGSGESFAALELDSSVSMNFH